MTTGESAKGRLMTASIRSACRCHLWRTRSSAQPTPKTVLSGTAIATISRVSLSACRPSGEVIASIGGAEPVLEGLVEDHPERRQQEQRRGSRGRGRAGPSGWRRSSVIGVVPPAAQRWTGDQPTSSEQRAASSSTTETAAAPASLPDSIWPQMKTEETSVLNGMLPEIRTTSRTRRAPGRRRAATPARMPGSRLGKMIRRKTVKPPAPSEAAASSISRSSSISTGCTARTTNGSVTKQQRDDDRGPGEGDVDADRAVGAVEGEQGQAGDDRRQGERQVDDRVDDALAGELVADEHPGDDRAEDRVDHDHDQRGGHGQLERRDRLRRR